MLLGQVTNEIISRLILMEDEQPPATTTTAPDDVYAGHCVRLSVAVIVRATTAETVAGAVMLMAPVLGLIVAMFSPTNDMLYVTGPLPSGEMAVTVWSTVPTATLTGIFKLVGFELVKVGGRASIAQVRSLAK